MTPKVAIQEENHPRWLSKLSDSGSELHRLERFRDQRFQLAGECVDTCRFPGLFTDHLGFWLDVIDCKRSSDF